MAGRNCKGLVFLLLTFVLCASCRADSGDFACFDTKDVGIPDGNVPRIEPWKIVALDPEYSGQWMVAADVDRDGQVEIVSAENVNVGGDGRDEIMAGYAMLNHDGSVRWAFKSKKVDQSRGHMDCARVVRQGGSAEDFRIAITCCGANNIALVDGNGKTLWEISGNHFESIDIGRVIAGHPGPQIIVDIDHQPYGNSPVWVLGDKGELLGRIVTDYSRHHCLLDWTGDGVDEILVAHKGGLYDDRGKRIATFHTPGAEISEERPKYEKSMLIGDMSGDGIPDVVIATPHAAYIYKNTNGRKPDKGVPLGTGFNFTLY